MNNPATFHHLVGSIGKWPGKVILHFTFIWTTLAYIEYQHLQRQVQLQQTNKYTNGDQTKIWDNQMSDAYISVKH